MSDATTAAPWDGTPFTLELDRTTPLATRCEAAGFDFVHFFLRDAITSGQLDELEGDPAPGGVLPMRYALRKLVHDSELRSEHFELSGAWAGWEHVGLSELLAFATRYPDASRGDVLALGIMRWRQVFEDRAGETRWGRFKLEQTMCQWVVGLGGDDTERRLVPCEVFLGDLLRRHAWVLVRRRA